MLRGPEADRSPVTEVTAGAGDERHGPHHGSPDQRSPTLTENPTPTEDDDVAGHGRNTPAVPEDDAADQLAESDRSPEDGAPGYLHRWKL